MVGGGEGESRVKLPGLCRQDDDAGLKEDTGVLVSQYLKWKFRKWLSNKNIKNISVKFIQNIKLEFYFKLLKVKILKILVLIIFLELQIHFII